MRGRHGKGGRRLHAHHRRRHRLYRIAIDHQTTTPRFRAREDIGAAKIAAGKNRRTGRRIRMRVGAALRGRGLFSSGHIASAGKRGQLCKCETHFSCSLGVWMTPSAYSQAPVRRIRSISPHRGHNSYTHQRGETGQQQSCLYAQRRPRRRDRLAQAARRDQHFHPADRQGQHRQGAAACRGQCHDGQSPHGRCELRHRRRSSGRLCGRVASQKSLVNRLITQNV